MKKGSVRSVSMNGTCYEICGGESGSIDRPRILVQQNCTEAPPRIL